MKQLWTEKYRPDDIDGYVFRDAEQKAQVKIAGREISQSIYEAKNMALSGLSF